MLVFVGAWVAGELFGIAFPSIIKFFAFAWNPAPEYLHPGIAIGTAAGWATGVCRALLPPRSFAKQAHARIKEYEAAKEAREQAEDNEMEGSRGDGGFEEKYDSFENDESHEENCEEQEPWYEVLGVSPEANEGEIKTAYRERIKQYHPDRVSGLGEKLQLLAKAETQRLNTAREEGLSLQR